MTQKKSVKNEKSPKPKKVKKTSKSGGKKKAKTLPSLEKKKREKLPEKPEDFADLIQDILRNKFEMCTFDDVMKYLNERYEPPIDTKIIRKIITEEFRKGCLAIRPVKWCWAVEGIKHANMMSSFVRVKKRSSKFKKILCLLWSLHVKYA